MSVINPPAPGAPYFTPYQEVPAGTAVDPQPDGRPIPKLFQPLTIRGVTFQNRIFLSPLCQYSSVDGMPTPWHIAHLGGIASRGPGLTFTEATAVLPEGRITPSDTGIWSYTHTLAWKPVVDFIHSQNAKIGIQLAHAGRKASCIPPWVHNPPNGTPVAPAGEPENGWPDDVLGPSDIAFSSVYPSVKALTKEGIKRIVDGFREAARRSVEAGFDVIEIHNAHGYLLSSFLSPTSNKRTDEYGGSFENRIRLTLEVVDAVRSVIPESMPLFLRISGTEWLEEVAPNEPQWRSEDTARLAPILASHGVDLIDVSAGGNDKRQKIRPGEEYQVPFAAAAKAALEATGQSSSSSSKNKTYVGAVGGLYSGKTAAGVLESGKADVVFVGRYFQKNPGQVWAMADELGVDIRQAKQIEWGFRGRGKAGLGWNKKQEQEPKL